MSKRTIRAASAVLGLPVGLELDADAIRKTTGLRRRAVARAGARVGLGLWVIPNVWAAIGCVLSIEGRGGTLCIGVRDRHVPLDARTAPARTSVDAVVDDGEFDALLGELAPEVLARARSAHDGPGAFELFPNRATGLGSLRLMLPWLQTMLFLCIVGPIGGMTIGDSPVGQAVLTAITLAAIATGIVRTFRGSSTPPPTSRLEIGDHTIVLRAPAGAIAFDVPRASATLVRGVYTISSRSGTTRIPTLELRTHDRSLARIGVWDGRDVGPGPKARAPRYLASAREWDALLAALSEPASP